MFENMQIISQLEYDKYQHIKVDKFQEKRILERGKILAKQYRPFFEDFKEIEVYLKNSAKNC